MTLKFISKANKYLYFLLGVAVIFSVGIFYASRVGKNEEKNIKNQMLVLTETFASELDAQKFVSLQQNLSDIENPDYITTKQKLLDLNKFNKIFSIRWIYTMVPKNGHIVFSVDSIPTSSPDYSAPGDIYTDASPDFVNAVSNAWTNGESSITQPYVDKWGNFISVVVPIIDSNTNKVVSVLASDMDYQQIFIQKVKSAIELPIFITSILLIIFSVLFFYLVHLFEDKKELVDKNLKLKQSEYEIRELWRYLNNIINTVADPIFVKDEQSRFVLANDALCNILGVAREDIIGKAFDNTLPEDQKKHFLEIDKSVLDSGEENTSREVLTVKDGKNLNIVTKKTRYVDEKGNKFLVGIIRDTTDSLKMEGVIEEEKEALLKLMTDWTKAQKDIKVDGLRMNAVISSMGEGLIIIDRQYKVNLINPKALELLGYEENEILGKDLHTILKLIKNKKDLAVEDWPTERSFATNQIVTTSLEDDFSITTERQKNYLAVTFSISPLASELESDATKIGLVIVVRDANKDRELDRVKSGFVSIASHQLRTPLTSIRWYSEMLLSGSYGVLTEAQSDLAREIHEGANRLYQTINLLLGISRVESGKFGKEKMPINLTAITTEVIKELSPSMVEKKLVFFSFSAQTDPIIIKLDPMLLRQVILNLFANSIRYTNNNGTIEGRWLVDEEKKEVVYSVRDNGIGIPKEAQSKIFSKFFRADNAMSKIPDGSGLGLAFVKDIVTSWGGRVWFETEEGKGTTFFFTIPQD